MGSFSAMEEGCVPLDISHHRLWTFLITDFAHLLVPDSHTSRLGQRDKEPLAAISLATLILPFLQLLGLPRRPQQKLIAGESLALVPHAEPGGDSDDMSGHRAIYSTLLISAVTTRCLQQGQMEVPDAHYSSPRNTLMFGMGVDF